LIKTMPYGADPNDARVLMAIGKCFDARMEPARAAAWINGAQVIENGMRPHFGEAALRESLAGDPVEIEVDLGVGSARARAWGCDLKEGYIKENAAYYSS